MSGEMIKSGWAQSGSMAIWPWENRSFVRHAVLDAHWDSKNWQKLCHLCKLVFKLSIAWHIYISILGTSLLKNLKVLSWSKTQCAIADNMSRTLTEEMLASWIKVQQEFDLDPLRPNPYEEPDACMLVGGHFAWIFILILINSHYNGFSPMQTQSRQGFGPTLQPCPPTHHHPWPFYLNCH